MKNVFNFLTVLFLIGFFSCAKSKDTTKPSIIVNSPGVKKIINQTTDSLLLDFLATDNSSVTTINVKIIDSSIGSTFYQDNIPNASVNSYNYIISTKFTGYTSLTTYIMTINVKDDAGNTNTDIRTFYVKP